MSSVWLLRARSGRGVSTLHRSHGLRHQCFEDIEVDVGQALDVQTGLGGLVLAELGKQGFLPVEAGDDVDGELGLPDCEAAKRCVAFVAGRLFVVVAAEPDDAGPPHRGFFIGDSPHQGDQAMCVCAA